MPTSRRSPLLAGFAALLTCAALLAACGRDQPGDEPTALNNIVQQLPTVPAVEKPLDRERLLLATLRAASAFAAGTDDSAIQRSLDGKRFELRLRFGCGEAGAHEASRGWRFDAKQRALRLKVAPDISSEDPVAAAIAGDAFETVEGFWLRRPWLLAPACPAMPPAEAKGAGGGKAPETAAVQPVPGEDAEPAPAAVGRRVGIAQYFTRADSRTARRKQRPYESTTVLDAGQAPSAIGYDFVLSGRLRALPDRRVIACASDGPQVPPSCIISADIDRAWIERPDNRRLIAEWTGG